MLFRLVGTVCIFVSRLQICGRKNLLEIELIKMANSTGDKTPPCGTSVEVLHHKDYDFSASTRCRWPNIHSKPFIGSWKYVNRAKYAEQNIKIYCIKCIANVWQTQLFAVWLIKSPEMNQIARKLLSYNKSKKFSRFQFWMILTVGVVDVSSSLSHHFWPKLGQDVMLYDIGL